MSLEFVKSNLNSRELATASKQQKQISYFTQSEIQDDISVGYLKQWAERNYQGTDYFLAWVKSILQTPNFLTFYKNLRKPLPSAGLINDEIKPQLRRVFFSDDSYFKYIINNKEVENPLELDVKNFDEFLFNAILFNYNDVLVHDVYNEIPFRELVSIDNINAIESKFDKIQRISYSAMVNVDGEETLGYLYIDKSDYIFYDNKKEKELLKVPHDLGFCPATWISNEKYSLKNDIVRKSMFSYAREPMEEYVFLNTMLKMTEPRGAIPTTVRLKPNAKAKDGKDKSGVSDSDPMSSNAIGGQQATETGDVFASDSIMQVGTEVRVPIIRNVQGNVDMEIIKNFAHFFYIPTECLKYINDRIHQTKRNIIIKILGDYLEMGDYAKNEFQVSKSFTNKQDKLRSLALNLTWIRETSDKAILGLKYGVENVEMDLFHGSDFFLDVENELYEKLGKSINPIERRNVLIRLSKIKNRFNKDNMQRETILYSLLPFASDVDFDKAIQQNLIDEETKLFQLKFYFWIDLFEAEYGDVLQFWNNSALNDKEKIILITNILKTLIKTEKNG